MLRKLLDVLALVSGVFMWFEAASIRRDERRKNKLDGLIESNRRSARARELSDTYDRLPEPARDRLRDRYFRD